LELKKLSFLAINIKKINGGTRRDRRREWDVILLA
jgi:hypothetical protein